MPSNLPPIPHRDIGIVLVPVYDVGDENPEHGGPARTDRLATSYPGIPKLDGDCALERCVIVNCYGKRQHPREISCN
jgi:hypothetical protein